MYNEMIFSTIFLNILKRSA